MSRVLAAFLFLFVSLSARAQQPRFGEKIEVKLVTIDVIVTGRGGERIYGLTARDFEAFESGDRQQITNFAEYRSAPVSALRRSHRSQERNHRRLRLNLTSCSKANGGNFGPFVGTRARHGARTGRLAAARRLRPLQNL